MARGSDGNRRVDGLHVSGGSSGAAVMTVAGSLLLC
jgi:hypothetical protein